ncbi:MAG: hypothetical protein JW770_06715 [Actinobacteria bacterium]|nr:hypothetical protein [Actinomycetota bacterium]
MQNKRWIPIDAYFLSNGFPTTSERADMVQVRLKRMGYDFKNPERFKEIHQRLIDSFYRHRNAVHIQRKGSRAGSYTRGR